MPLLNGPIWTLWDSMKTNSSCYRSAFTMNSSSLILVTTSKLRNPPMLKIWTYKWGNVLQIPHLPNDRVCIKLRIMVTTHIHHQRERSYATAAENIPCPLLRILLTGMESNKNIRDWASRVCPTLLHQKHWEPRMSKLPWPVKTPKTLPPTAQARKIYHNPHL